MAEMSFYKVLIVLQLAVLGLSEVSKETIIRSNIQRDYDRLTGPMVITGEPLNVSVGVLVSNIGPLNEAEMTLEMRIIVRMIWQDPRFVFHDESVSSLQLPGSFKQEIWTPDLYFPEAKSFKIISNVKDSGFIQISNDGTVLMSLDVQLEHHCPLDLSYFPWDTQACSFYMESYGQTSEDLILHWKPDNALEISHRIEMKQFKVVGVEKKSYSVLFSTGTFSDLEIRFILQRAFLCYFLHLTFPAAVIVFISWVALWIPRAYTALRLGIGVAALLSMLVVCNMGNAAKNGVSTITAADCFLALCFIQVFGALVTCLCQSLCCNCCSGRRTDDEEDDTSSTCSTYKKRSTPLCDKIFGTIFPATFVILIALFVFYA